LPIFVGDDPVAVGKGALHPLEKSQAVEKVAQLLSISGCK
jgi:hypothetical protein